jgi:hypothetical protein
MKGAYEFSSTATQAPLEFSRRGRPRPRAYGGKSKDMRRLTPAARSALLILRRDTVLLRERHVWRGMSGERIQESVIQALFDRYLVSIFVENRPRPHSRYTARLTEIGRLVAAALAGAGDEIDDCTEVYGEAAE